MIPATTHAPAAHPGMLLITLPAGTPQMLALRDALDVFAEGCGASIAARAAIGAALTEAFTCVVEHRDAEAAGDSVRLLADVEGGALEVIVRHTGEGISALQSPDARPEHYGLELLREVTAGFSFDDGRDGRRELWMRFDLS